MNKWRYISIVLLLTLVFLPCQSYAESGLVQAQEALSNSKNELAMRLLRKQIVVRPRDYQAWFLLGVAQARLQHFHPAIEAFRRVIELREDLAEPHNNLAVIYNELGDAKAAVMELELSLAKHPGSAVVEENMADLYVKLALQFYKKALEKADDSELEQRYLRLLQVRDPSLGEKDAMAVQDTLESESNAKPVAPSQPIKKDEKVQPIKTEAQSFSKKNEAKTIGDRVMQKVKGMIRDNQKEQALTADVLAALEAWRQAWQTQDLDAYFAAYDKHYIPSANYANLEAWKRYKRRVIGKKSYITVTLSDVKVLLLHGGTQAKVKFKQIFRSNSYSSDSMKLLKMEKKAGVWKIVREVSF